MDRTAVESISRRTLLVGLAGTGAVGLVGWPAEAATPSVKGRILEAYLAAGGKAVLGKPKAKEVGRKVRGHHTYAQQFEHGQVWWGSGVGKVDLPHGDRVRLDDALNFRPLIGVRDLWRSDDLDHCTPLDDRIVHDLGVRTMIAFNGGSDRKIRSVEEYEFHISNSGTHAEFYPGYVSRPDSRLCVGEALTVIAATKDAVLIHCNAGKDRTGWVSDVLQRLAGVPRATRDTDYLATQAYSDGDVDLAWLQAARDQLVTSYQDLDTYLTQGCLMTPDDVAALRRRLKP